MSMVIDIYDYFDRWLINYIVYHKEHLIEYGDVERANTHFSAQYQDAISKMDSAAAMGQLSLIQGQMQSQSGQAASGLKILSDLQVGGLLESTMDEIARGINEGIELASSQVTFDNYNTVIQQAKSFSNMLSTGQADVSRINEFFNLLLQSLEYSKMLDINVLNALSNIGTKLVGTSFQIDATWQNKAVGLTNEDIQTSQKILDSLTRAANKMNSEGIVSSRSFATTINYIFSQVIGNKIQQMIVAEGIQAGINTTDSLLDKLISQSNGKLSWVDRGGQSQDISSSGVANIFNHDAFSLRVQKNGQTFDIEIGTNTSAQWYKKNSGNQIQAVATATLGDYFTDMSEKYLAYNIIAHRTTGAEFEQTFNIIRASTAASFFNGWVQNGGIKSTSGQTAQFMIVNGKVYPVMRIISNICDDIMRNGGQGAFELNVKSGEINKWQGKQASLVDAIKRSNMVNKIMDVFTISATLNNNILTKYAY